MGSDAVLGVIRSGGRTTFLQRMGPGYGGGVGGLEIVLWGSVGLVLGPQGVSEVVGWGLWEMSHWQLLLTAPDGSAKSLGHLRGGAAPSLLCPGSQALVGGLVKLGRP